MLTPKIIIRSKGQLDREMQLSGDATIGRAFDNTICIDDTGVSRYHAIIEQREKEYWLSDLGSRNGTSVNQEPVISKRKLQDGDSISIGDRATLDFHFPEKAADRLREPGGAGERNPTVSASTPVPSVIAPAEKTPRLVILAAAAGLVIIVGIVLLLSGVFSSTSGGAARIVSPQTGTTVKGRETIRVEVENQKKIERIIYLLDGIEIASAQFPPYDVELDPANLSNKVRNLSSSDHILTLTIEDKDGNRKPQPDTVLISFETVETTSSETPPDDTTASDNTRRAAAGNIDVASLCRSLAAQISGKSWYTFDAEFTEQIRQRAGQYPVSVIDDARRYRREIGNAFGAKGLPLSLGFVMAMSQSRFQNTANNSEQTAGMWRVPRRIAVEQGYIAADEPASALNDAKRSSEIAAAYMKELINVFGMDDFLYAIACYGMPVSQAAQLRARLEETDPTVRRDFWKLVKAGVVSREGADRVARFFAAGIVGENPRLFGIGGEPLSSLY